MALMELYREPFYRFSFAEARRVKRIHLDGLAARVQRVGLYARDKGNTSTPLALGHVMADGWVELDRELVMAPGEGFDVYPEEEEVSA
jgi:hypothetical protein